MYEFFLRSVFKFFKRKEHTNGFTLAFRYEFASISKVKQNHMQWCRFGTN